MPTFVTKPNPKDNPTYPYARSETYFEITDGEFLGLHFNFGNIETINGNINFDYNLLFIPEGIAINSGIERVIGDILQELIERGYYEFSSTR